jgi:chromosome segregation ATPase
MDIARKEQDLDRFRNNSFNLESNQRSMMNAAQQKDILLRELTGALEDLKYQHDGLTSSSNALAKQYSDVSEARSKLDDSNIKLNGELLILKKQQEYLVNQEKHNLEKRSQAIETRIRGESGEKIKELNQDVETLQRINAYYKTELSKPQHMSIGAIARQEGFKMPLASSSINYRKNNLGTGQATLLKFGKKES